MEVERPVVMVVTTGQRWSPGALLSSTAPPPWLFSRVPLGDSLLAVRQNETERGVMLNTSWAFAGTQGSHDSRQWSELLQGSQWVAILEHPTETVALFQNFTTTPYVDATRCP